MDLGLELLMNPKKKVQSDAGSVASGSVEGDRVSVRIKSVDEVSRITSDDDDEEAESFVESVHVNEMHGGGETASTYSFSSKDSRPVKRAPPVERAPKYAASFNEDAESKSDLESLGSILAKGNKATVQTRVRMSEEEVVLAKREYLYQFDRLEKKGMRLPRKFTLASSLDDMKTEYERLKRDKELDNAIKFQRKGLTMVTAGIEFLNSKFDPLNVKLDGWSESIHENIEDYDEVFEELHEKYKGKAKMAPELKLLMTLGGSAFMFHMTQSMFKTMPGIDQVFKQNPDLAKQFAAATASTMQQQQPQGSLFSGISGMFSNMFGGPGQASPSPVPPQPTPTSFNMKGPSNVDDIMKELERNDNDRIEVMSTVTSSEFTELQDDVSINNLVYRKKGRSKPQGRSVTLDL